jgi:hypothetical protein
MPRVGQWMLNLVHQGFQPSEIFALGFHELKFFSDCHDFIQKAQADAVKAGTKNKKR